MIRRVSEGLWELLCCAGFGVAWLFIAAVLVLMAGMPLWMVFKWNEQQVKLNEVVKLAPMPPLFGQRAGKTHWLVFMKPMPEALEHPGMDEEQAQETVCALENVVHDLVHGKRPAPSQVLQSRDFDIE